MSLSGELKEWIISLGGSLTGFADLEGLLPDNLKDYPKGISIGIRLNDNIIDGIKSGPTKEYYKHYNETNKRLNAIAERVRDRLMRLGFKAYIIEASKRVDDAELKGLFPHKTAATRAGLGWIGKTALLVTKKFGPRVRLVTVLTDAPLESGGAITESYCGECDVCVEQCPAGASKGINWRQGMERKEIFDAYACSNEMDLNIERMGERLCGICVSVCPYGK